MIKRRVQRETVLVNNLLGVNKQGFLSLEVNVLCNVWAVARITSELIQRQIWGPEFLPRFLSD
jgi:hypothetical protein